MSYDRNYFELIGRVADIRTFDKVTKVRIAASMPSRDKDKNRTEVDSFTTVTVFADATRKYIDTYAGVGDTVGCEGWIKEGCYDKDGETHYTTDAVVSHFGIIASKREKADQKPVTKSAAKSKR